MPIEFHYLEVSSFRISKPKKTKDWLEYICNFHNFYLAELNFIFCSDAYLYNLNYKYLKHHTLTDVITFNFNVGNGIQGDIYISVERVELNAIEYEEKFEKEIRRVMVHGLLHLLGFTDNSKNKKLLMTEKEDFALSIYFNDESRFT